MSSTKKSSSKLENERGVFLLIVALALVTIFTLIGLGIDGGSMYLSGLGQQRAADAASLAAGRMVGRLPDDRVKQLAQEVARDNFELNNIPYEPAALDTHFQVSDIIDNEIQVTTSSDMPTLIAGHIVPGPTDIQVRAAATARRNFPAVILVIDNTGSMLNIARDAQNDPILDAGGNPMNKLDVAKAAARNFVRSFSTRDRIGIVSYSLFSTVHRSIAEEYDEDELIAAINSIPETKSATNIQIGLLRPLRDMENWLNSESGLRAEWPQRYIVLMTDGTPNQNARDHDQDPELLDDWTRPDGPDPDSEPDPVDYPAFPTNPICRSETDHPDDVHQQNFVEAQIAADFVRSFGHTVLTVAIGEMDTTVTAQDPWGVGDPLKNGFIRGNFMRWLANDYAGSQEQNDITYPEACVPSYQTMADRGYAPGISLISNNAGDIDGLFQTVASYISLRLTS